MTKRGAPLSWRFLLAVLIGAGFIYGLTDVVLFAWATACTASAPDLPACDFLVIGHGVGPVERGVPALVFVLISITLMRVGRPRPLLTAFAGVTAPLAAIFVYVLA